MNWRAPSTRSAGSRAMPPILCRRAQALLTPARKWPERRKRRASHGCSRHGIRAAELFAQDIADDFAARLAENGATIHELSLPASFAKIETFGISDIVSVEASRALRKLSRPAQPGPRSVRRRRGRENLWVCARRDGNCGAGVSIGSRKISMRSLRPPPPAKRRSGSLSPAIQSSACRCPFWVRLARRCRSARARTACRSAPSSWDAAARTKGCSRLSNGRRSNPA